MPVNDAQRAQCTLGFAQVGQRGSEAASRVPQHVHKAAVVKFGQAGGAAAAERERQGLHRTVGVMARSSRGS